MMITRILASMIRMGLDLFFRIVTCSLDREDEESDEEAGEAVERPESSSSSPQENNAYESAEFEVFLSFCGKDTRKSFTGHLHQNLTERGVKTFIDHKKLRKGEKIDLLHRYVERSNVFLPVFSKGYADSKWCLRELSTAVKCKKKIIPVFFNVEPSDLKGGGGCFARSFQEHAKNKQLDQQEVKGWVDACKEAESISGYHLQNDTAGHEAKLINMIAKDVMTRVRTNLLDVSEHFVGLKPRVEEIKGLLLLQDFEGNGVVRVIGIVGMGGIGKTTLAKAVHDEIGRNFDACSFLSDVRQTFKTAQGLRFLQTQMVRDISGKNNDEQGIIKRVASRKKVLVVLDDVDHRDQLKALAGASDWFGKGSRIIITTRDKSVLIGHGIEEGNMYAIDVLNDGDSMELFSYHAFVSKQPPDERYKQLAEEVVCTAGGLPLALEVLGSQFFDMKKPEEWEELIRKLKKYPSKDVYDRLRISYDELDQWQKEVFLDIACFFIGRGKEYVILMWDACDFYPSNAIKVLLHGSLIKITNIRYYEWELNPSDEVFSMHDQIRDMGRNIVLQESSRLPGRRSRFWDTVTIEELQTMEEPKSVQGIEFLEGEKMEAHTTKLPANLWGRHTQLRYLWVHEWTFQGNCLQFPASLKWLRLTEWGLEQPSAADFDLGESLVILELLGGSCYLARAFVEQSFLGRQKAFQKLKVLDLRWTDITTTPDFNNVPCPNLEMMILWECTKLTTVHESIGQLKRLETLDLRGCTQLSSLPYTLQGLTSLKVLVLDRTDFETVPDFIGKLRNLRKLSIRFCKKFSSLPNTLGGMTSLEALEADGSGTTLENLPDSIWKLTNLRVIRLSQCQGLFSLPDTLADQMTNLYVLRLHDTGIETLPESIGKLTNLQHLSLWGCENLSSLPNTLGGLISLEELFLDWTNIETVPNSVGELRNLKILSLCSCKKLSSLPNTLGGMTSLEVLMVEDTYLEALPGWIGELRNLKELYVCNTQIETLPDSIWKLTNLRVLRLSWCQGLFSPPNTLADKMTSLRELGLGKVRSQNVPDSIGALTNLHQLGLGDTWINTLSNFITTLTNLRQLRLRDMYVEGLPEWIGKLTNIRELDLSGWESLSSLPETLGDMTSLEVLKLNDTSIKTLPDSIGELANLRRLSIQSCAQLKALPQSIRKLSSLEWLEISGTPLKGLKDDHAIEDLMAVDELNLSSWELVNVLPDHFLCETLRRLCVADPTVEALPESMGQWGSLRELSLDCKTLKALPESISTLQSLRKLEVSNCSNLSSLPPASLTELPLLPPSLVELNIVDCIHLETMASVSHLTSLTTLRLSGCSSLRDIPGMKNITNNLKRLILPGPGGSLRCNSLNDHIKKTVLQESTFDALCNFGLESGSFSPTPGAGRQHRLYFMMPRYIPWTSCKEFTGELLFDGELCTVNDHEEAHWRAHVEVVADDRLTVVAWMPYTFLPGNTIVFRETNVVMQAMIGGHCCNLRVFLELPEELKWIKMSLNLKFR